MNTNHSDCSAFLFSVLYKKTLSFTRADEVRINSLLVGVLSSRDVTAVCASYQRQFGTSLSAKISSKFSGVYPRMLLAYLMQGQDPTGGAEERLMLDCNPLDVASLAAVIQKNYAVSRACESVS